MYVDELETGNPTDECAYIMSITRGSVVSCQDGSPVDDDVDNGKYDNPGQDNLDEKELKNSINIILKKLANIKKNTHDPTDTKICVGGLCRCS